MVVDEEDFYADADLEDDDNEEQYYEDEYAD